MMKSTLASLLAVFSTVSSAHAYAPPSFFVIRMLARKHAGLEQGRFQHRVSAYKRNGELLKTFEETVIMTDAEHVTARLRDANGAEVGAISRKLTGSRAGNIERPVAYDLLMLKDGAGIFEHFKALGLPLRTEADLYAEKEGSLPYKPEITAYFAPYENRVVEVLGEPSAKPESLRSANLQVEKDSFLPVRALFPTAPEMGMASEPLEFRMSGYQVYKPMLYPRVVQVFRSGALWAKIETQEVKLGALGTPDQSSAKAQLDGETREFVETYFKWVR